MLVAHVWTHGTAAEFSVGSFFKRPLMSNVCLSPDGKYIAFLTPLNDVMSVATLELDSDERGAVMKVGADLDVATVKWGGDTHIVCNVIKDNVYAHSLFSLEAGKRRPKFLNEGAVTRIEDPLEMKSDLVAAWILDEYRMTRGLAIYDIKNADIISFYESERVPGNVLAWHLDSQGDLIGARTYLDGEDCWIRRDPEADTWQKIVVPESAGLIDYEFLVYDEVANVHWLNGFKAGQSTSGLYRVNVDSGSVSEELYRDDRYDLTHDSALFRDRKDGRVVGIRYLATTTKTVWFDPFYLQLQALLDRNFKGYVNVIHQTDRNRERVLFESYSDRQAGIFRVLDLKRGEVIFVGFERDDLPEEQMSRQLTLNLEVRDGLLLEGYVTLPGPQSDGPFPMVTLAHGGPWARDAWGFDAEAQFLANRGYAVLQLNFRGSTGYGREISHDQSGHFRGMIDDLSEATRRLVSMGVADQEKLAIMGTSFGGYAAMASAAFDPDLYQCAISVAGTFDIEKQIEGWREKFWTDRMGTYGFDHWVETVGDPESETEYIASLSPINFADEIRIPALLIHGNEDVVVDKDQSKALARSLRRAGNPPKTIFLKWESHGKFDLKSNKRVYSEIEAFLHEHLR